MSVRCFLAAMLILLISSMSASAGLIITIGNATVAAGATTTVDILIRSDPGTTTNLASFGFEVLLTTPPSVVHFTGPQPDAQLTEPLYVFFGDSAAHTTPFPVGSVSSTLAPNDTFIGGDSTNFDPNTNSFTNVVVTDMDRLLARLEIGADELAGNETGSLSLIPSDNTFFFDANFNDFTFVGTPFTSTSGTITVQAAGSDQNGGVVPEPTSLSIFAFGGIALLVAQGRRRFHKVRS